mmetsp:Transcript_40759/g.59567  ORF Transcript_40759/g.59567 Transcript_40759/m.59567 type:complete len:201 (-) Transcript_40759:368-970(-)
MVEKQLKRLKPIKGNSVFVTHPVGTRSLNIEKACIEWGKEIGSLFPYTTEQKLNVITEWHPWFSKEYYNASVSPSPWGKPILSPEALNQIMLYTMKSAEWPTPSYELLPKNKTPVSLFGGCEIKLINGPVFVGETYFIEREITAVGETPKTEFIWTKTVMKDEKGCIIAEMTLQDMMLKYTVENYDELRSIANGFSTSKL